MEIIRIPQVSLVDATTRSIGVYSDDPKWWQQLKRDKKKSQNLKDLIRKKLIKEQWQKLGNNFITDKKSDLGSRSELIKNEELEKERTLSGFKSVEKGDVVNEWAVVQKVQCTVIGETPLHIAIIYDDLITIKNLVEVNGVDVNQRSVDGKFLSGFQSKQTTSLIAQSKYNGLAYFGEYPLAFAACFASKEVYDYLIEKGADPNMQDTYGNTVLHVLVINNKIDMFKYTTNHPRKKALLTIKNYQDLTPINLAAKLGRKDIFSNMLETQNLEFWRYSNITCSAYPLEGLDTIDFDGKIAPKAALSFIVEGDTDEHLDMLEIGVVKRLLEDKWATFAQRAFFKKLIVSFIHLIFLSISVYTRANDDEHLKLWPPKDSNTIARYISEIAVVLGCIIVEILQIHEIIAQGLLVYLKNLIGEPANVLYQMFCILTLAAVPFRFVSFQEHNGITPKSVEDVLVILAIPCGWLHLLFYARVATLTGPFVVMIYKMITGDILTFGSVHIVLLFGFSLAYFYLYKNVSPSITAMQSFPEALIQTLQMNLGEFKYEEFGENYYCNFLKVIFVIFMVTMHITLLSMLIAMMGNTYHQIIAKSEKEWRKQWAHIVLLLERSFTPPELRKFQDKYCIKIPSKDPNNPNDIIGLMVIKKAPKTKQEQSKNCIRNWKKYFKSILQLLKENEFNAQGLLDLWSNKDEFSSKKKKAKKINWQNSKPPSAINNASSTQNQPNTSGTLKNLAAQIQLNNLVISKMSRRKIEENNLIEKEDTNNFKESTFFGNESSKIERETSKVSILQRVNSDLDYEVQEVHLDKRSPSKKIFYQKSVEKIYGSESKISVSSQDFDEERDLNKKTSMMNDEKAFPLWSKFGQAYIKNDELPQMPLATVTKIFNDAKKTNIENDGGNNSLTLKVVSKFLRNKSPDNNPKKEN